MAAAYPATHRVLIAAGLIFYIWGAGAFIFADIVLNLIAGVAIGRYPDSNPCCRANWVVPAAVATDLALLGTSKYARFTAI